MSDFGIGEYVVATANGYGPRARGYGSVTFQAGQELQITSRAAGHLNVRKASGGLVFRISPSKVRKVGRMIGEIPEGGITPEDPRVAWLFEDAGRMADRLGLCKDYDRLCEALGIPGRVRNFTIKVAVTDDLEVTARVSARSKKLAEQRIREQFAPAGVQVNAIGATA